MSVDPTDSFDFLYAFGGYTYGSRIKMIDDSPILRSNLTGSAGYNGSSQGPTMLPERRIEAQGTITAATQADLRAAKDEFMRWHGTGRVRKLILQGNRWLWATVDAAIPFKIQTQRIWRWEAQFVCGDPFYYEEGLQTQNLSYTNGSTYDNTITASTVGGNTFATPYMAFDISAIDTVGTSYILVQNNSTYLDGSESNAQRFNLYPRDTGNYTMYFGPNCTDTDTTNQSYRHQLVHETQGVTVNKWRKDAGEITLSSESDNVITVTLSGVTLAGNMPLNWLQRYI